MSKRVMVVLVLVAIVVMAGVTLLQMDGARLPHVG